MTHIRTVLTLALILSISATTLATPGPPGSGATKDDRPSIYYGAARAALLFLKVDNSARANALGGCAINLVDEQSPQHNPGALGLFHLSKVFSFSVPNKNKWLPDLSDDLRLSTLSASAGISLSTLEPDSERDFDLSLGVAYSRKKLDYGRIAYTEEDTSVIIGYYDSWDESVQYSIGLGFEYRGLIKIGIGYTHKKIESQLGPPDMMGGYTEVNAYDYGTMTEVSLHELVPHQISLKNTDDYVLHFELIPSMAYVVSNIGDDVCYTVEGCSDPDPLPETQKRGMVLYWAAMINESTLFSCRLTSQTDRDRYNYGHFTHRSGCEFGLFETFYYRTGRFNDRWIDDGDVYTWGTGFSLRGVLSWLDTLGKLNVKDKLFARLLRTLDIRADYTVYETGLKGVPLWDSIFWEASISF